MIAAWWMVLAAGAFGGLLGYLIGPRTLERVWTARAEFLPYALLGIAAGYISIYVLDAADPQQGMRCIGVALIAGIAWKPVIDGGKELVLSRSQRTAEAGARSGASTLERLVDKLGKKPGDASIVEQIGAKSSDLIGQLSEVRGSPARARAIEAITKSLDAIAAIKTRDDPVALRAISGIVAASMRGDGAVFDHALDSAARLPVTPGSALAQQQQDLQRLAQLA